MAKESEHIAFANRSHETLQHLLREPLKHSPWIATVAFYKAVHIVEAIFANESRHSCDHSERESWLKITRKYEHICKHYLPLARASTVARYLVEVSCFEQYLGPTAVIEKLLQHRLYQIEKSARSFLKNPTVLIGVETLFESPT